MIGVYLRQKADYWKKLLVIDNQFGSGAQEKKHLWAKQLLSLFWMLLFSFLFFCNVVSNTSSLQTSTSEGCWPQWPQFITIGISRNKKRNHFSCLVFKDWNDLTKVCNSFSKLVLALFLQREWESRLQHLFYKGRSIWNIWHERGKKPKSFILQLLCNLFEKWN